MDEWGGNACGQPPGPARAIRAQSANWFLIPRGNGERMGGGGHTPRVAHESGHAAFAPGANLTPGVAV